MASDLNIVLYQPVIPQNTGSIARMCACTGAALHLIHPLGFDVGAAAVKRAGLDYWPHVNITEHENWDHFLTKIDDPSSLFFFSKFAKRPYTEVQFPKPSYLVFGSESTGLPEAMRNRYCEQLYLIPMRTHIVRSLNLAQCAAIVAYEALRQSNFLQIPY